ncbi:MAG: sigma-70 family RNA polymerase sigma factor [Exilibacterium sp.]
MTRYLPTRLFRARLFHLSDSELLEISRRELPYVTIAYEALISRYQSRIKNICYRYTSCSEEAEEITQEVMLKVFHSIREFRGNSSFKTWLYRIAYNEAASALRCQKQILHIEYDGVECESDTPERQQNNSEEQRVNQWLKQLDAMDRSIVVFRCTEDLTYNEIAIIVGLKLSAVKMRYQRALEKLKRISANAF